MRPPVCQYDFEDPDLRSHGCTIASLAYLRREATAGDAWDDPDPEAARLRAASGVPLATFQKRGTTLDEAKRAYELMPFEGRVKPFMKRFSGGSIRGDLIPGLTGRRWAVVAVNYGVIQTAKRGVGSFAGGHAVVVGDPENGSVTVADPLRRQLVKWPVALLEEAAEKFGENPWLNGRGEFGIVAYAPTILELRTQQRDKARAALAAAQRAKANTDVLYEQVQAVNRQLSNDLATAQQRVKELEARTPAQDLADERGRVIDAIIDHAGSLR